MSGINTNYEYDKAFDKLKGKNKLSNSPWVSHWQVAAKIFQDNKFTGVGLKNFRNFCDDDSLNSEIAPIFHDKKCATHPHSFYFEILSEIGLLGLFLITCLFLKLFYDIINTYLKTKNYFMREI